MTDSSPQEQTSPAKPQRSSNGCVGSLFSMLILLGLMAVGATGLLTFLPNGQPAQTLIIARGSSVQEIAAQFTNANLAAHPLLFRAAARLLAGNHLQAGEYEFTPEQSLADMLAMLHDGRSVIRRQIIIEGLTSQTIVDELNANPALTGTVETIPPEGSLLPETYHYSYGDKRSDLITRMTKAATDLMQAEWDKRDPGLPITTPQQAIIMASLIEKETGKKPEERARVAGVFYNRMRVGMRMQSDPTVIYAMAGGKGEIGRDLTRDDLGFASPYNTYFSDGLPPGPICNPGRAAILAALHPEAHDYLYFVADGTGGHAFAKDLAEHNRNAARWYDLRRP